MPTPVYTLQQYNDLVAAIAQGALKVRYADKEVTYNSLKDMLQLKYLMAVDLGLLPATGGKIYASFSKGIK